MFFVVEEVDEAEEVFAVQVGAVGLDVSEEFDLINRLVEVILIILNNLHADHLLRMNIVALDSLREGSATQVLDHLVTSSHDTVDHDREVLRLFEASFLTVEDHAQVVTIIDDVVELGGVELVV